ncbi:hypothetical protein BC332_16295 [Capsicum chinense]|nr:hypothetical protein BC332_16295 [Capsicum chinense]
MDKREAFAIEEGLHQAIMIKLSSGAPDLKGLRTLLPKHLEIKDHCLICSLAPWKLLLWCDQYDDYNTGGEVCEEEPTGEKFQGNIREFLNEKRGWEDGDQRPYEKNQKPGLLASFHPDVEVHNNVEVDNLSSPYNSTQFEHSISEEHATGDESANKIKGVHSSIVKDWTVVAHKKYLGIQIGSPARVNVQLARNVSYA